MRHQSGAKVERRRAKIAAIESQIRAGNPDLPGLCLTLVDWSAELRLLLREQKKKSRRS